MLLSLLLSLMWIWHASAQITLELEKEYLDTSSDDSNLRRRTIGSHLSIPYSSYTTHMQIGGGRSRQHKKLIVDTRTSTVVFGGKYNKTSTRTKIADYVAFKVDKKIFPAHAFTDDVHFGPVTIKNATLVHIPTLFNSNIGYLGLGAERPGEILNTDIKLDNASILDQIYNQGLLQSKAYSLCFKYVEGAEGTCGSVKGTITMGGHTGIEAITQPRYVSMRDASEADDAQHSYTFIVTGFGLTFRQIGNGWKGKPYIGTVDSTKPFTYLPESMFHHYHNYLQDSRLEFNKKSGETHLILSRYDLRQLEDFTVVLGGTPLTIPPEAQIVPPHLAARYFGVQEPEYLSIFSATAYSTRESGLDFIMGQFFMERFLTIFDIENRQIGFGETAYTRRNTLGFQINTSTWGEACSMM